MPTFAYSLTILFLVPILKEGHPVPEVQAAFVEDIPMLAEFFKIHPNSAGYHPKLLSKWIYLLFIDAVAVMFFAPFTILAFHLIFRHRLKKMQKLLTRSTFKTSVLPIPLFPIPFDSDSWPSNLKNTELGLQR